MSESASESELSDERASEPSVTMDEETGTGTGMKRGIGVFFKPLRSASLMAHSPEDEIFNVTSSEVQLLRPTQAERASVAEGFTASRKLYELNNPT